MDLKMSILNSIKLHKVIYFIVIIGYFPHMINIFFKDGSQV